MQLESNKKWLKFIVSGKAADYVSYINSIKSDGDNKRSDKSADFDGRSGDKRKNDKGK